MSRALLLFAFLVEICAGIVLVAQAPPQPAGAHSRALAFVRTLSQALSRRDREAVAELVRYPLNATVSGIAVPVPNRAELLRLYEGIFTAELRCVVEDTIAKGAAAVQIDGGGVTFGSGRIHATDVGGMLQIAQINVPPATGVAAPPNPPPRRLTMRRGQARYSGRLYGDGVDTYIISARRGDVVQARIEQFPGRSAAVRVVEQNTGKVLDRRGASAPRVWSGTIQEPGDYRVEVVRLAPYCLPSFTYLLTITLK
jgi:hypothetical protein